MQIISSYNLIHHLVLSLKSPVLFFLSLWLFVIIAPGQAQNVREFTDRDTLKAGDTFQFSLTLDRSREYEGLSFPDSADFGPLFEIRSRQQYRVTPFKDSLLYELQFFGTADTVIPSLPLGLIENQDTSFVYSERVPVYFQSVLSEEEESLRPLKPIFEFAQAWGPFLLALLLLLLGAYLLYKYFLQSVEKEPEPAPPAEFIPAAFINPLKQLQKTIDKLEQQSIESEEEFEEFYIILGDAIRRYFENLHHIPALESTSRELLQQLKSNAIDKNLIDDTKSVLQEADMVKFARFQPTSRQAARALSKAADFLDRARKVDGPRVEHLRREHNARMEAERERFEQKQQQVETDS